MSKSNDAVKQAEQKDVTVIKMEDGGTLILNGSPSQGACERFLRVALELKNKYVQ